ncbi:WhiB family transcriptional regulator [Streptomyces shenzhenensis]
MDREWELRAACRSMNPDVFFSDASKKEARAICDSCPVVDECLDATLKRERGEGRTYQQGIFAGLSGEQRWDLDRARRTDPDVQPKRHVKPRGSGRKLAKCGTRAAYQRHVRKGEPIDDACRAANARGAVEYRATGSTQACNAG